MTQLSARFTQGPNEVKRYMLDWSAQLSTGETVASVAVTVNNLTTPPVGAPACVCNGIVVLPDGQHATFFVSGGADAQQYELVFLATTSIGQVFEDVVEIDVTEKS